MSITQNRKQELIDEFSIKAGDTGSADVQIAVLTERIRNLTEHMQSHKKDFHSRRGLLMLVGRRRRLLDYVKRKDFSRYEALLKRLELRRGGDCNDLFSGKINFSVSYLAWYQSLRATDKPFKK